VAAVISAITPTRGRPERLRASVASLFDTAEGPIEVVVAVDIDDTESLRVAREIGCVVVEFPERLGYGRLNEYFSACAEAASGEWVQQWDDCAIMQTPGWDTLIRELPEHILVGDLRNHFSPDLCCFPVVRRAAINALGRYCLDTPHVDTVWQDIGRSLGCIAPVAAYVHHDRPDITGIPVDATHSEGRLQHRSAEFYQPAFQAELAAGAERVRSLCLEF
jgi:hypothetical protein